MTWKASYGRRTAARRIQSGWRKYRKRNSLPKKFVPKVKKIVHSMEPTRSDIFAMLNNDVLDSGTLLNNLTNITFQDDPSTFGSRQGTKVKLMSFRWRGTCTVAPTASDNKVRLLIVKKTAMDAAAFSVRSCFLAHPGTTPALINLQINKRYCHCVYDKTFQLQNQDPSTVLPPNERYPTLPWVKNLQIMHKFPGNCIARYPLVANATNVQSYNQQYYFIGVSDASVLTPEMSGIGTLFFKNA